jgi:hypothetical protein
LKRLALHQGDEADDVYSRKNGSFRGKTMRLNQRLWVLAWVVLGLHGCSGVPVHGGEGPATLSAQLFPENESSTQSGVVDWTASDMKACKGRLRIRYEGEVLTGDAICVRGKVWMGVARAASPAGTSMSCEYRLDHAYQGAGTCVFSNGAQYQAQVSGR